MRKICYFFLFFLFFSCYRGHLYVQQEKVDKDFLASTHVGSPDFRLINPPKGIRIITSWDFPNSMYKKQLSAYLTVRFWNNEEKVMIFPLQSKRGDKAIYFANLNNELNKKVLTYKVEIKNEHGIIIETWKHHFWKELIDVDIAIDKEENQRN